MRERWFGVLRISFLFRFRIGLVILGSGPYRYRWAAIHKFHHFLMMCFEKLVRPRWCQVATYFPLLWTGRVRLFPSSGTPGHVHCHLACNHSGFFKTMRPHDVCASVSTEKELLPLLGLNIKTNFLLLQTKPDPNGSEHL